MAVKSRLLQSLDPVDDGIQAEAGARSQRETPI
jgi:hypothetical protein